MYDHVWGNGSLLQVIACFFIKLKINYVFECEDFWKHEWYYSVILLGPMRLPTPSSSVRAGYFQSEHNLAIKLCMYNNNINSVIRVRFSNFGFPCYCSSRRQRLWENQPKTGQNSSCYLQPFIIDGHKLSYFIIYSFYSIHWCEEITSVTMMMVVVVLFARIPSLNCVVKEKWHFQSEWRCDI